MFQAKFFQKILSSKIRGDVILMWPFQPHEGDPHIRQQGLMFWLISISVTFTAQKAPLKQKRDSLQKCLSNTARGPDTNSCQCQRGAHLKLWSQICGFPPQGPRKTSNLLKCGPGHGFNQNHIYTLQITAQRRPTHVPLPLSGRERSNKGKHGQGWSQLLTVAPSTQKLSVEIFRLPSCITMSGRRKQTLVKLT